MNIHHLELFYYVARHRGISRALPHIPYGIQQPAVSSQLIQLEKELGVTLFRRRPFELTRRGEVLFDFVRPFFGRLDEIEELLRSGTRFMRIGASDAVVRYYLPAPLQKIRRLHPEVRLSLRDGKTRELMEWLVNDELDLVIGPVLERMPPGVVAEKLVEVRPALLVQDSEPARSGAAFLKSRAGSVPLISLPRDAPLTRLFLDEFTSRGLVLEPSLEVSSLDLVQSYVAGGFGAGLLIDEPSMPKPPNCRILPLRGFPKIAIAAFHQGSPERSVVDLLEMIRRRAQGLRDLGS